MEILPMPSITLDNDFVTDVTTECLAGLCWLPIRLHLATERSEQESIAGGLSLGTGVGNKRKGSGHNGAIPAAAQVTSAGPGKMDPEQAVRVTSQLPVRSASSLQLPGSSILN